jgi:hypothetical protein
MTDREDFPHLVEAAAELGDRTDLSMPELRSLLCGDCDFYGDDHEDDLECSCFMILRLLLEKKNLTPAELARALSDE